MKPEDFEQIWLMDWVRCHPDIHPYIFHIRNEAKRSKREGHQAKLMGLKTGVSDLFLALPVKNYHGMWIELKSKNGKPSDEQLAWLELMKSVGYHTGVYYGWVEAAKAINNYLGKKQSKGLV